MILKFYLKIFKKKKKRQKKASFLLQIFPSYITYYDIIVSQILHLMNLRSL